MGRAMSGMSWSQAFHWLVSKACVYHLFYSQIVFVCISSMTHLHTYCNDRILEWRRNLLLRPWSWNRNVMKHTMREQGQNAAAGEARKGEKHQCLNMWLRPRRPPWDVRTQCGCPCQLSGPGFADRVLLTVSTSPGHFRRKVKWKMTLSSRKPISCLSHFSASSQWHKEIMMM